MRVVPLEPSLAIGQLLRLAWPITVMNVLGVVTVAVDTALVGHLPDAGHALAAMAFAGDIVMVLTAAMIGLSVATAALMAGAWGQQDQDAVATLGGKTTQAALLLGLAVAAVGPVVAPLALAVMGADDATAALALEYLVPLLLGAPFTFAVLHFAAVYRALGRTLPPLGFAIGMNLVNVGLDGVLIFGELGAPALGIAGAAMGTLLAQAGAAAAMGWHLHRTGAIAMEPILRRPEGAFLSRAAAIGGPVALDVVVVSGGFFGLLAVLGRLSTEAVAAHTVGLRVQLLALMPGMALSAATAALVGQDLGAGRIGHVRTRAGVAVVAATLGMGALGGGVVLARGPILAAFGLPDGSETRLLAADWMLLLALTLPLAGTYHALEGVFHGAGRTRLPTRINAVALGLLMVPAAMAAGALGLGPRGVWVTFPLAYAVKAAAAGVGFARGAWHAAPALETEPTESRCPSTASATS